MNKKIAAPLMALVMTLTSVAPQKSEAGMLIAVGGLAAGQNDSLIAGYSLLGLAAGVLIIAALNGSGGLYLLDVDASLPMDQLSKVIHEKLPFIDSHEGVNNLAIMTKERFATQALANPEGSQFMIRLPRDEVEQALSSTDLNQDEFEQAVKFFE